MQDIDYYYLPETDSTNMRMWSMIDSGRIRKEGSIVRAGMQYSGKGMGNTSWQSERGKNLLFSVLLKPDFISPAGQFLLNKCIATSVREALASLCPEAVFTIKWPNDIYSGNGKISGTLIENRIMGRTLELSVVGIGINVNQEKFHPDIPNPVSLKLLCGRDTSIDHCLKTVILQLKNNYRLLKNDPENRSDAIEDNYLKHLLGYGHTKRFRRDGRILTGTICGVDKYGKLLLKDTDGKVNSFGTKEIEFIAD